MELSTTMAHKEREGRWNNLMVLDAGDEDKIKSTHWLITSSIGTVAHL
jgi:hypothetical protein